MSLDLFCQELEEGLNRAESCEAKVQHTEKMLLKLCQSDISCCKNWECCGEKYARHLVFQGEQSGCSVVAMAWAPDQATPLHDHDGTWCVEGCLEGKLEVIRYELQSTTREDEEDIYHFEEADKQSVGCGSIGCLIPPFEHHIIRNPFEERAITLHVYGRELTKASCFEPVGERKYKRVERCLSYSSV